MNFIYYKNNLYTWLTRYPLWLLYLSSFTLILCIIGSWYFSWYCYYQTIEKSLRSAIATIENQKTTQENLQQTIKQEQKIIQSYKSMVATTHADHTSSENYLPWLLKQINNHTLRLLSYTTQQHISPTSNQKQKTIITTTQGSFFNFLTFLQTLEQQNSPLYFLEWVITSLDNNCIECKATLNYREYDHET